MFHLGKRTRFVVPGIHAFPVIDDDALVRFRRYIPKPHQFIDVVILAFDRIPANQPENLTLAGIPLDRCKNIAYGMIAVYQKVVQWAETDVGRPAIVIRKIAEQRRKRFPILAAGLVPLEQR